MCILLELTYQAHREREQTKPFESSNVFSLGETSSRTKCAIDSHRLDYIYKLIDETIDFNISNVIGTTIIGLNM